MAQVIGGVITDNVDHRRVGAAGIVQIGKGVAQPRPQMEQRRRRFLRHARIAIRRAGADPFKKTENCPHGRHLIDRGDKVHFGRAGVGKTGVYAAVDERLNQAVRAIHKKQLSYDV